MFTLVVLAVLAFVLVISWLLWKSGFLFEAEKPVSILDVPITDARAQSVFKTVGTVARGRENFPGRIRTFFIFVRTRVGRLAAREGDPALDGVCRRVRQR